MCDICNREKDSLFVFHGEKRKALNLCSLHQALLLDFLLRRIPVKLTEEAFEYMVAKENQQ